MVTFAVPCRLPAHTTYCMRYGFDVCMSGACPLCTRMQLEAMQWAMQAPISRACIKCLAQDALLRDRVISGMWLCMFALCAEGLAATMKQKTALTAQTKKASCRCWQAGMLCEGAMLPHDANNSELSHDRMHG